MGKPWRLSKLIFFAGRDKNLTKPRRALLRESERRREEVAGTERGRGGREGGREGRVYSGTRKETETAIRKRGIDIGVPGGDGGAMGR